MNSNKKQSDLDKYRPWIETRLNANIKPTHKILSRQLHLSSEPTLTIHTAGQNVVWELSIREAAKDQTLLDGMEESDKALVKWLFDNDAGIEQYHYKKT